MDLKSMTLQELEECMKSLQEPKFRAKQLYEWMHKHLAFSWDEMKNIPKKLKEKISDAGYVSSCVLFWNDSGAEEAL